jgi:hypothetical protein
MGYASSGTTRKDVSTGLKTQLLPRTQMFRRENEWRQIEGERLRACMIYTIPHEDVRKVTAAAETCPER